jgi:hypothetical protein
VFKHIDGEKLEQNTHVSKDAGMHLTTERNGLQIRHDEQVQMLKVNLTQRDLGLII